MSWSGSGLIMERLGKEPFFARNELESKWIWKQELFQSLYLCHQKGLSSLILTIIKLQSGGIFKKKNALILSLLYSISKKISSKAWVKKIPSWVFRLLCIKGHFNTIWNVILDLLIWGNGETFSSCGAKTIPALVSSFITSLTLIHFLHIIKVLITIFKYKNHIIP